MKQILKKFTAILTTFTIAASISVTTWAEENNDMNLQINGEMIAFDNLKPINRKNRVFVPLRDTLQQMGAEVYYDDTQHLTTAQRGDTTIQFHPGETNVTVIKNGVEKNLETSMVISSGNTYIPIRFLGEAFDYPVGWDAEQKTALLIDTDKLLADAGSFSIMNRYMEYNKKFSQQPYIFKGTFSFELNMPYNETTAELMPITGSGTFEGISEQDKQNMSMAMQLNTEGLKKYIATEAPDEETSEIANTVVNALENIEINYITDISTAKIYFQSPLFALADMDGNAWYYMDLNEFYSSMGMDIDFSELVETTKYNDFNFEYYIKNALASVPLTSVNDYNDFQQSIGSFVALFGDNSFQQQADGYTSQFDFSQDGADIHFTIKLLESNNEISGYDMNITAGTGGTNYITVSANQNDTTATVTFHLSVPNMLTMVFNCGMTMEATDQKALSQPSGDAINIMDIVENIE
ncbi:copper amine oxidase N-terminal domain-containing protein [Clostridium sp. MD294]|uniref:copper amine oxidase N-terminal domain-containing protein n=1 Tax=Clostridium sp. MD294 TaxID=97138 RepID=UPI0002CC47D5|nr:copper amine oxidase N-terminal domain-containing protein [Clostridium sp. MD294]USF30921.1 hypothetical protein C820_002365 [Clostridium sp. MD294]